MFDLRAACEDLFGWGKVAESIEKGARSKRCVSAVKEIHQQYQNGEISRREAQKRIKEIIRASSV